MRAVSTTFWVRARVSSRGRFDPSNITDRKPSRIAPTM
jgi:hypothetical protein